MVCKEVKICVISATFLKRLIKSILKYRIHIVLLVALSVLASSFQGRVVSLNDTGAEMHGDIFSTQVSNVIKNKSYVTIKNIKLNNYYDLIETVYQKNNFRPLWTVNYGLSPNSLRYIELLSNAHYYGLDPNEYGIDAIQNLQKNLLTEKNYLKLISIRIEFEIILTYSSLRFINALQKGILFERNTSYDPEKLSNPQLIDLLSNSLKKNNMAEEILKVQPQSLPYIRLQAALQKFIQSVEMDHSGIHFPNESEIAEKIISNILISLSYARSIEDKEDFIVTLKKFQKINGLDQTGKLDMGTRKALILSTKERINKIAINLERIKHDQWKGNLYLLVNIPSFKMKVVEDNREVAVFKTQIGRPVSPTPIFSGKISQIVTNPSWIVPESISKRELLYRAKKDTTFLKRNQYVMFDSERNQVDPASVNWEELNSANFNYMLIQKSNPSNALGKLKFLFPNKYNVYVHDTPSKKLFARDYRAYSHGCVRLENPHYLAEYIMKKQQAPSWEKLLKRNLSKGIQQKFDLNVPIDIHLRYYTCEADENGQIYFYDDIYNLDKEMMDKMNS